MNYQSKLIILIIAISLLFPSLSFARVTPEDILNEQKASYNQKVKNYSSENKQKLENLNKKISQLNKQKTKELEQNMLRQSEILEEYIRRAEVKEKASTDGVNRNLTNPTENARYWITYAHEAVAYQAAKVYVFNLTGEANLKKDSLSSVSTLENDLGILKNKVIKSQKIIQELVND